MRHDAAFLLSSCGENPENDIAYGLPFRLQFAGYFPGGRDRQSAYTSHRKLMHAALNIGEGAQQSLSLIVQSATNCQVNICVEIPLALTFH